MDADALAVSLNTTGTTSLTAGTTLIVNGSSGGLTTVSSGGGTKFGALGVTGNLNVTSAGAVTQGGAIAVTGSTGVNAGGNAISLNDASNDFGGAVSLTGGTTQITDATALTLGALNTGALTVLDTGALNLGSGSVGGALSAMSNGGSMTQTGAIGISGASNLNAGTGSITLTAANDFGGSVTALATGITLTEVNTLTPASINAGAGSVRLTAAAIAANPGFSVTGASATLSSGSNVSNLNVDFQGTSMLLTGSASTWTLFGPVTQPSFSVTNPATNIFYNGAGISGAVVNIAQQSAGAIGGSINQIAAQALQDALDRQRAKQIDYGFAGDVGTTPPMDHRIDETRHFDAAMLRGEPRRAALRS